MVFLFYAYIFFIPLVYLQERIPKGPRGVNYANVAMLVLVLCVLLHRAIRARAPLVRSPLNGPLILFLGWSLFGLAVTDLSAPGGKGALDPGGPLFTHFLRFANSIFVFWFATALLDTRVRMRGAIVAMALAAFLVIRSFHSDLVWVQDWHYSEQMRVAGPFSDLGSNELGAFFTYSCLFFMFYALQRNRIGLRALLMAAAGFHAYGLLFSYSRASWLAFVLGIAAAALLRHRLAVVLLLLAALTANLWVPNAVIERIQMTTSPSGELDASAESRTAFWAVAWQLFERNPLMGSGVGSFQILNPSKMDTHNVWMRVLCEQGLVGFGLFVWIWLAILAIGWRLWREGARDDDRHYGFCLIIATLSLMIANVFGDRFTYLPVTGHYWVLAGIAARLYAHLRGAEALEDVPEAEPACPSPDQTQPASAAPADLILVGRRAAPHAPDGPPSLTIVQRSEPAE